MASRLVEIPRDAAGVPGVGLGVGVLQALSSE